MRFPCKFFEKSLRSDFRAANPHQPTPSAEPQTTPQSVKYGKARCALQNMKSPNAKISKIWKRQKCEWCLQKDLQIKMPQKPLTDHLCPSGWPALLGYYVRMVRAAPAPDRLLLWTHNTDKNVVRFRRVRFSYGLHKYYHRRIYKRPHKSTGKDGSTKELYYTILISLPVR